MGDKMSGIHTRQFRHDDAERKKWQDPEAILHRIGLGQGDTFIDVGCGEGFFALPAARIVGSSGKVYGADIDAGSIERLAREARREGLTNLILRAAPAEDMVFCVSCADYVFFGIDLHDFSDPGRVILNAKKMLSRTGKLIDLDWKKEPTPMGPPLGIRFSETEARALIEASGFRVVHSRDEGPYHYLITAVCGN